MARKAEKQDPGPERPVEPAQGGPVIDEVRQLVQLMVENELCEVDVTDGPRTIRLTRGGSSAPALQAAPAPAAPAPASAEAAAAEELIEIRSPMVGTFYAASSPDSDPYAEVGDAVNDETVVCIVEAMKVMNEVKAECAGTIVEVCVHNTQPVEYGQTLFRVRPA